MSELDHLKPNVRVHEPRMCGPRTHTSSQIIKVAQMLTIGPQKLTIGNPQQRDFDRPSNGQNEQGRFVL